MDTVTAVVVVVVDLIRGSTCDATGGNLSGSAHLLPM
jgi:hypothetical protein